MYLYIQENWESFYSQDPPTEGDLDCIVDGTLSVFTTFHDRFVELSVNDKGEVEYTEVNEGGRMIHRESGAAFTLAKCDHKHHLRDFEPILKPGGGASGD